MKRWLNYDQQRMIKEQIYIWIKILAAVLTGIVICILLIYIWRSLQ